MMENTEPFIPTWLYIKTHNQTGLQYLGKTKMTDPFKYEGSGIHWIRHLKKHGKDISTFIIGYYTDEIECRRVALFYSWFFDVVKSDDWANLKFETLDGGGAPNSEELCQKKKESMKKRAEAGWINPFSKRIDGTSISSDRTAAGLNPLSKRDDGSSVTGDRNRKLMIEGTHNWQHLIKKECPHCHRMIDPGNYGQSHGDNCKENPNRIIIKIKCEHCGILCSKSMHTRYHSDNCKQKHSK